MDDLTGRRVCLEALAGAARLPVQHHNRRARPDRRRVAEVGAHARRVALAHPEPVAVAPAHLVRDAVVLVPDLRPACVAPPHPRPVRRVVPVHACGEIRRRGRAEPCPAVVAGADPVLPEPAPAVVGEAVGPIALGDLAQDRGHALPDPGAVHAHRVEVAPLERLPSRVAGEPARVVAEDLLVGAGRVHPGQNREPGRPRRREDLAEEVAPVERGRAVVPGEARGVEGHDPAGVDDHALGAHALPVVGPEPLVVRRRVLLVEVRLHPAAGAEEPGTARVVERRRRRERSGPGSRRRDRGGADGDAHEPPA